MNVLDWLFCIQASYKTITIFAPRNGFGITLFPVFPIKITRSNIVHVTSNSIQPDFQRLVVDVISAFPFQVATLLILSNVTCKRQNYSSFFTGKSRSFIPVCASASTHLCKSRAVFVVTQHLSYSFSLLRKILETDTQTTRSNLLLSCYTVFCYGET